MECDTAGSGQKAGGGEKEDMPLEAEHLMMDAARRDGGRENEQQLGNSLVWRKWNAGVCQLMVWGAASDHHLFVFCWLTRNGPSVLCQSLHIVKKHSTAVIVHSG